MNLLKTFAIATALATATPAAHAKELALAYFMGPSHPMNAAVFTPFAERLAEISGGELTVRQFPGGALNSVPPKQYSILLNGVTDIAFALPGYTGELFPKTNVVTLPGVCDSAVGCTEALLRARDAIEAEFDAKLLAVWANAPPVLITKDKPVRAPEDMAGMKVRVTSSQDVPFAEALGASAVAQPVTEINQNLTNGVIDAIAIDPSAIASFKLHEPANHITTYFPGSGSAFVLLMNNRVYDGLTEEERGWIDAAADDSLSRAGGEGYEAAKDRGIEVAREAGVEIIELSEDERARFEEAVSDALDAAMEDQAGDATVGEIYRMMQGAGG